MLWIKKKFIFTFNCYLDLWGIKKYSSLTLHLRGWSELFPPLIPQCLNTVASKYNLESSLTDVVSNKLYFAHKLIFISSGISFTKLSNNCFIIIVWKNKWKLCKTVRQHNSNFIYIFIFFIAQMNITINKIRTENNSQRGNDRNYTYFIQFVGLVTTFSYYFHPFTFDGKQFSCNRVWFCILISYCNSFVLVPNKVAVVYQRTITWAKQYTHSGPLINPCCSSKKSTRKVSHQSFQNSEFRPVGSRHGKKVFLFGRHHRGK